MPPRNQPRSSRGRSAIARKIINTNSTNGMMYQGSCITSTGKTVSPCHYFGGNIKGGAAPSATGFMRSMPWKISVPAKNKNFMFKNNRYFNLGYKPIKPQTDLKPPTPIAPTTQPDGTTIIGPYLQLITNLLWKDGNAEPYVPFIMNIQYYNQGNYFITYPHLFSDTTGGPYSMTNTSSINAIYKYFKTSYKTTKPEDVLKTIILGKPINTKSTSASNGAISITDLSTWLNKWSNEPNPPIGGYMFWSACCLPDSDNAGTLVDRIGGNPENKVIYIGAGDSGTVFGANTCGDNSDCINKKVDPTLQSGKCVGASHSLAGVCQYEAWSSDPSGVNVQPLLKSYADAKFNILILAFWNYTTNSDWVSDWANITPNLQQQIIKDLHGSGAKVLVSGGGAGGNVGPNSGPTGTKWGKALATFAIDNNLDGVDLDLEGGLLGTWWSIDMYNWVQDAIVAIQTAFKPTNKIISFAPVAPLCANPIVDDGKKYSCDKSTGTCNVDTAGTQSQTACEASCKAPTMYSCDKSTGICSVDTAGTQSQADCESLCKATMYSCDKSTGTCSVDTAGTQSQTDCESLCKATMYSCDKSTGTCSVDTAGTQSQTNCEASCKATMYSCDKSIGTCSVDTAGTQSQADCKKSCTIQKYKCVGGKCVPRSSGGTLSICEQACTSHL